MFPGMPMSVPPTKVLVDRWIGDVGVNKLIRIAYWKIINLWKTFQTLMSYSSWFKCLLFREDNLTAQCSWQPSERGSESHLLSLTPHRPCHFLVLVCAFSPFFHQGRDVICLVHLYPYNLKHSLGHSRCSINIYWLNKMNVCGKLSSWGYNI